MGSILVGIEKATNIIGRCAIYEELYLASTASTPAGETLEKHLLSLYASILRFLGRGKEYYGKRTAGIYLLANLSGLIDDIQQFELPPQSLP
jgi:hypothetical protein